MQVAALHADASGHTRQMLDAFGTSSHDFMSAAVGQLIETLREREGVPSQVVINAALAVVGGAEPDNEIEALLASQMAATHALAMCEFRSKPARDSDVKPATVPT